MRNSKVFTVSVFILLCMMSFAQEDFSSTPAEGCAPLAVKFKITGIDTTSFANVFWQFGVNNQTSGSKNPDTVYYTDPGTYTVRMQIGSNPEVVHEINVYETVTADFRIDSVSNLTYACVPTSPILYSSEVAYSWEYSADTTIRYRYIPVFDNADGTDTMVFADTGLYKVSLRVTNITDGFNGCVDTSSQWLMVYPPPVIPESDKFKPGNVFVPNSPGDGYYVIEPEDPGVVLSFEVFTRTGVSLYKAEAPSIYWDGRTNDGRQLNSGVYFYVLQSIEGDPEGYYDTSGFIHIYLNVN